MSSPALTESRIPRTQALLGHALSGSSASRPLSRRGVSRSRASGKCVPKETLGTRAKTIPSATIVSPRDNADFRTVRVDLADPVVPRIRLLQPFCSAEAVAADHSFPSYRSSAWAPIPVRRDFACLGQPRPAPGPGTPARDRLRFSGSWDTHLRRATLLADVRTVFLSGAIFAGAAMLRFGARVLIPPILVPLVVAASYRNAARAA
jgi:hypothetical protein